MEINFNGKRALVTGATKGNLKRGITLVIIVFTCFFVSSGIGRDIAVQLSKCGAKVTGIGRSKDLLGKYDIFKLFKLLLLWRIM